MREGAIELAYINRARRLRCRSLEAVRKYCENHVPRAGPHMVHSHTAHLPLGALLTWCAMCGTGADRCRAQDWPPPALAPRASVGTGRAAGRRCCVVGAE